MAHIEPCVKWRNKGKENNENLKGMVVEKIGEFGGIRPKKGMRKIKRRENETKEKKKNEKERRIRANKKKEVRWIRGKKKGENEQKGERKKKRRGFRFSLRSIEIGLSIFIGARGKVDPRNESYTWVPKSRIFVKLQEVENFSIWIISSLKTI